MKKERLLDKIFRYTIISKKELEEYKELEKEVVIEGHHREQIKDKKNKIIAEQKAKIEQTKLLKK